MINTIQTKPLQMAFFFPCLDLYFCFIKILFSGVFFSVAFAFSSTVVISLIDALYDLLLVTLPNLTFFCVGSSSLFPFERSKSGFSALFFNVFFCFSTLAAAFEAALCSSDEIVMTSSPSSIFPCSCQND